MADYEIPEALYYTEQDEWARREDGRVVVGISDYAQKQLGDIVFVDLPEVGTRVQKGRSLGVIESVKAVSDFYAPLSGEIVARNDELGDRPEMVNEDCYGDGWLVAVAGDLDEASLLDAAAYRRHVEERSD